MTETLHPHQDEALPGVELRELPETSVSAGVIQYESHQNTIMEGLSESDREIVTKGSQDLVDHYKGTIVSLENQMSSFNAGRERVEIAATVIANSAVASIGGQVEARLAAKGFAGFAPEVKAKISEVVDLQATLESITNGSKLSHAQRTAIGIAVPKYVLPSKKRHMVQQQLIGRIEETQADTLRAAHIKDTEDVTGRALFRAGSPTDTKQAEGYIVGTQEKLGDIVDPEFSEELLVLAAIGKLDEVAVHNCVHSSVLKSLDGKLRAHAAAQLESVSVDYVYQDHTLAGQSARREIQDSGLDETFLITYHKTLLARGLNSEDASAHTVYTKASWLRRAEFAQEKFEKSLLAGDTILEHYTPFAVDIIKAGGLHPKSVHGITSINNRSEQVHFTSLAAEEGESGGNYLDYRKYAEAHAGVRKRIADDVEANPVSGVFTVSLTDAVEGGLNCAGFTVKRVGDKNYPNDIIFSDQTGQEANFSLGMLDLTVLNFKPGYGDMPIYVYDHAVANRLDEIRSMYLDGSESVDWQDFLAQHLDREAIAKQVLLDNGANSQWVENHVHAIARNAELPAYDNSVARSVVVPLAGARKVFDGEHVDGDSQTAQTVYLGVSKLAA